MENRKDLADKTNPNTSYHDIPQEIHEIIYSYLNEFHLFKLRTVAKEQRYAADASLIKKEKVDFFLRKLGDSSAKEAVKIRDFYRSIGGLAILEKLMRHTPWRLSDHQVLLYVLISDNINFINLYHLRHALRSIQYELNEIRLSMIPGQMNEMTINQKLALIWMPVCIKAACNMLHILRSTRMPEITSQSQDLVFEALPYIFDRLIYSEKVALINFSGGNFRYRSFYTLHPSTSRIVRIILPNINFSKANINNAQLLMAQLRNCVFSNVTGINAKFNGASIVGCDFNGAVLTNPDFSFICMQNPHFQHIVVHDDTFTEHVCLVMKTSFRNAKLLGANFDRANFKTVDFTNADLTKANFNLARLENVNLSNANLHGVSMVGTQFIRVTWLDGVNEHNIDARFSAISHLAIRNKFSIEQITSIKNKLINEVLQAASKVQDAETFIVKASKNIKAFGRESGKLSARFARLFKADAARDTTRDVVHDQNKETEKLTPMTTRFAWSKR